MNKKAKIGIAIGTTLVLGIAGVLIYNRVSKNNKAAKNYLGDLDDNGGDVKPLNLNLQPLKPARMVDLKQKLEDRDIG